MSRWVFWRRVALAVALVAVAAYDIAHLRDEGSDAAVDVGYAAVVRRANAGTADFKTSVPTVRVIATGCRGMSYGSGVIIEGGRVLTARHVVEDGTTVTVEDERGNVYVAVNARFDPHGRDAALLTVRSVDVAGAPVAAAEPVEGTSIGIIGHPFGGALHADFGAVSSYTSREPLAVDGSRVMLLDTDFEEGMSGGPVVDGSNTVVGIAVAVETKGKLGIAIPSASLSELLAGEGFEARVRC